MFVKIGRYKKNGKPQNVKVEVHDYDTWNLDATLAKIIWPSLEKYLETSDEIVVLDEPKDYLEGKTKREVLTELIWVFKELATEEASCAVTNKFWKEDETKELGGSFTDFTAMEREQDAIAERIGEGLLMFAQVYRSLWN